MWRSASQAVLLALVAGIADTFVDWRAGSQGKPVPSPIERPWLLASTWIAYLVGALAGASLATLWSGRSSCRRP